MRAINILRKAPLTAALIIAVASIGSIGAYAIVSNWFNGTVTTKQEGSIFTADVSGCDARLPGIEKDQQGQAKFKIVEDKGLTAETLQKRVLQMCEHYAALEFYYNETPFGKFLKPSDPIDYHQNSDATYWTYRSKIKAIYSNSVTLDAFWGGKFNEMTLPLSQDVLVYNQAKPDSLQNVRAGDSVVFVAKTPGSPASQMTMEKNANPFKDGSQIVSLFKTQFDMLEGVEHEKGFYDDNGIMPLDMYNKLHKQ